MTADVGRGAASWKGEVSFRPPALRAVTGGGTTQAMPALPPLPVPRTRQPSAPPSPEHSAVRARSGLLRTVGLPTLLMLSVDVASFVAAMLLTGTANPHTLILLALILVFFQHAGLYRSKLSLSILDDFPTLMGRALAAGAGVMILGGLNDGRAGMPRVWTAVLFAGFCFVGRTVVYGVIRAARRQGRLRQRTLILGAGSVAGTLAENLLARPDYGLNPEGFVEDDPLLGEGERPVPVLGRYDDLSRILVEHEIDIVIVTYGSIREPSMVGLLRACDRLACEIYFVPRLYELHTVTKDTEVLWGVPLIRLRRAPFRTRAWMGKRAFDAVVSAAALLFLAPVMLMCAALSRWETGSALFRQTRIGLDGRPFTVLKFCSLRPEEEAESSTQWNIGADARVGPFGKILRRTSLDELPQLWNVLRGDMSLVGPRPERPYFVDEFTREIPWYTARHRVPAGLTGWAQVHGLRGDTSIADRARFDNFYIENWSMWGDIKILMRTVGQVLGAAGR